MAESFQEISPSDFPDLYRSGYSINGITKLCGHSYGKVRKELLGQGVRLRTRSEAGSLLYRQGYRIGNVYSPYEIPSSSRTLTPSKIRLLIMMLTEGYIYRYQVGFTNNLQYLRRRFGALVNQVYGVRAHETGNVVRLSYVQVAEDLKSYNIKNGIPEEMMTTITSSRKLTSQVLRIFADTEGSAIVSVRRTKYHKYTVESYLFVASQNAMITKQVAELLLHLGIHAHVTRNGVRISGLAALRSFAKQAGFSKEALVVRKKNRTGLWYGHQKAILLQLMLRIYQEQLNKRQHSCEGLFANCFTRDSVIRILRKWYDELAS